jgi:hypothetical protein
MSPLSFAIEMFVKFLAKPITIQDVIPPLPLGILDTRLLLKHSRAGPDIWRGRYVTKLATVSAARGDVHDVVTQVFAVEPRFT